jgi:hypothetical protein
MGVEPYNYQNFVSLGPVFVFKQYDYCSRSTFQRRFNVSLDFENPKFCEENYCNNYTLSFLSANAQNLVFFVTEFLLTNSTAMCVRMATINHLSWRKSKMEVVSPLIRFINHGKSVENSWNLIRLFHILQMCSHQCAISTKKTLSYIKMIS